MRRYLRNFNTEMLPTVETDVLIVGAGIAGLWTALHLPQKTNVHIICKYQPEESNSWLAQGGIAAVFDESDTFASHIHDTLIAGAGLCDEKAVEILVSEAPDNIKELIQMGVVFDTDDQGNLSMGREGGHSCRRILHSGGDATGKAITYELITQVRQKSNIHLWSDTLLAEIITDATGVCGAIVRDMNGLQFLKTPNVVLATGGIGHLYRYTTNPRGAVGDGIAAAIRAGATVKNMEMVQFHPTTLMNSEEPQRLFLISEAVRGEGAILRNAKDEPFMEKVHPMKDLAPRDIVTRGILAELKRTGEPYARLDASSMSRAFFARRFPNIFAKCEISGIRLTMNAIPVHPAQHYFMGGIETDENGSTNVDGLWAVGECACNGVHGANRLASNSMLECLVFGKRCANHIISQKRPKQSIAPIATTNPIGSFSIDEANKMHDEVRIIMDTFVGAERTPEGLEKAQTQIQNMLDVLDTKALTTDAATELYAMLTIAKEIVSGALARKESVGAHYILPCKQ